MTKHPSTLLAALLVAVALAAACTNSGSSEPDGPTYQDADATTTTAANEETTTTLGVLPEYAEAEKLDLQVVPHSEYSDPVQAIKDTFETMLVAEFQAAGPPQVDPQYPAWQELVTGGYKEIRTEMFETWKEENKLLILPDDPELVSYDLAPRAGNYPEVEGAKAVLEACYVNGSRIVDRATGDPITDSVTTYHYLVGFEFVDERWRVSEIASHGDYEGVAECPEYPLYS